jgi:hypothetical protein
MIHDDDDHFLPQQYFHDARKFEHGLEVVKKFALQQYIVRNFCESNQWVIESVDASSKGQVVVTLVDFEKKVDKHLVFFEDLLL